VLAAGVMRPLAPRRRSKCSGAYRHQPPLQWMVYSTTR
jgi:hypothetical protein